MEQKFIKRFKRGNLHHLNYLFQRNLRKLKEINRSNFELNAKHDKVFRT